MRVLLDTNVIVDVLQRREPWFQSASLLFLAIARQEITGCISAKQAADIHYFARKQFTGEENVDAKARAILSKLFSLVEVIDCLGTDCHNALTVANSDYEDALLIIAAKRERIDAIITRNPVHFQVSPVPVYSPDEFIHAIHCRKD